MLETGIQVLDLKDIDLEPDAETAAVIKGAYETIEGTRKAILVTGLVIDGVEQHSAFLVFTVDSGNYVAMIGNSYILTITDDDEVTITTPEDPEDPEGVEA